MVYLIVQRDETSGTITGYWNGATFVADINSSDPFAIKRDARYLLGQLLTGNPDRDLSLANANQTLTLVP